jgi:hypothetical protein
MHALHRLHLRHATTLTALLAVLALAITLVLAKNLSSLGPPSQMVAGPSSPPASLVSPARGAMTAAPLAETFFKPIALPWLPVRPPWVSP